MDLPKFSRKVALAQDIWPHIERLFSLQGRKISSLVITIKPGREVVLDVCEYGTIPDDPDVVIEQRYYLLPVDEDNDMEDSLNRGDL